MFTKKRQIDPRVRRRLGEIGEAVIRAKLPWIMNVTALASRETYEEPLGDDVAAPLWAIEQWLSEKDARRQRWVKAAAILAGLAVVVALLAWFFPITDHQPELASTGGDINLAQRHPKIAELQWSNIGPKPARDGTVTIFTFSGGKRQTELGKGKITGAGPNVMPRYNGGAKIAFDTEQLGNELLACVIYFSDDNKRYPQAFLYHLEPVQNNAIELSELTPPPRYDAVCPKGQRP
jgi:hypothetical protein